MTKNFDNTKNELIFEPNTFVLVQNDIMNSFFSCSTYQLRLILMAIAKSMNDFGKTKNPREVNFTVAEFCDTMGMNVDGRIRKNIFDNLASCSKLQIKIVSDKKKAWVNWFEYVVYDEDESKQIKMVFTPIVFDTLKIIGQKFTKLDFSVIGKCSFYAIRWYMIAKEMMYLKGKNGNDKNKWTVVKSFDQIRQEMNIPDTVYEDRNNNFLKKVISNPIKELNQINGEFQIGNDKGLFTKIKQGRETVGVMIECNLLGNLYLITNNEPPETRQTKIACNNEEMFIQKYKKEFDILFEQEKINPSENVPFDNDLFKKARALAALTKNHPRIARRFGIIS